jgi:hypothetical protein
MEPVQMVVALCADLAQAGFKLFMAEGLRRCAHNETSMPS